MANWRFFLDGNEVEEPIGWDAVEFTAIRMESHGIDQPFSTEVRFYAEGARYIKSIYDQFFINQPIAITITSDVGYNGSPYQFDGFLNMAIYQEQNVCDTDSWEVTVGIIDDNFREQFKSRQDVEIDLTIQKDLNGDNIDPLTFKNIRMHRQELFLEANGKNLADSSTYLYNGPLGPNFQRFAVVPTYWQSSDFKDNYGNTKDTNAIFVTRPNWHTTPLFVNNTSISRTFNYTVKIEYTLTNNDTSDSITVPLLFIILSGNVFVSQVVLETIVLNPGQTVYKNETYTGQITIGTGLTASLFFNQDTFSTLPQAVTVDIKNGYTINLSELSPGVYASTANVLTIEDWLKRTIYVLTGSNNKLLSYTFGVNGCYYNNALTNGLRIRNGENQNGLYRLTTSWKEVFDGLDKIFCLGWAFEWTGSEWKIRVESRDYFYQNEVGFTFTNVGEVKQIAKSESLVNSVKIGYSDRWKNIQISGVYAIHTDRNYFIDNRAMNEGSSNKLDLTSNIIAEGYAIEFYRRLSDITYGGSTSDRPNDYDTFIIWTNRVAKGFTNIEDSVYNLPEETGEVTFPPGMASMDSQGLYVFNQQYTLYNLYHTPGRIAYRWWKVLGMHTYGLTDPRLRFQTGEYQVRFWCQIADEKLGCIEPYNGEEYGWVYEYYDIIPELIADEFKEYLFKPIEVEFSYPQSLCDFLTLSQDLQYKKVRITSGSLTIEGFIIEATNQPEDASGGTTKFRLLVSNQQAQLKGAFDDGFNDGYENGG